jgi:N-methylhydantoinase A/oxoprolinase/acetone carboxylase beta subunit
VVHFERAGDAGEASRVLDRYALPAGYRAEGPLIIEEAESTTVVPPGWQAGVDESGNLVLGRRDR